MGLSDRLALPNPLAPTRQYHSRETQTLEQARESQGESGVREKTIVVVVASGSEKRDNAILAINTGEPVENGMHRREETRKHDEWRE